MRAALGLAALAVLAACQEQADEQRSSVLAKPAPALDAPRDNPRVAAAAACDASETPIFSCGFADGKRVAVCGIAPGKAEYRFGTGRTAELVLAGGRNASAMYSGGGESQLAFDNGDTRYIVFSRMVRTRFDGQGNEPAISDGIVIERKGQFVAMRLCQGDLLPVDVNAASAFLPSDDTALFTEETMRADPQGDE